MAKRQAGKTRTRKPGGAGKLPLTVPRPWSIGCVGGAFEAGDAAFGLRFVRKGFGVSDDDDRLFALGYPHVVLPADVEVNLQRLATKDTLHRHYYPWRGGVWSRSLIERIVPCLDELADKNKRATALTGEAPKRSFKAIAAKATSSTRPYGEAFLYMVEAMWGTRRTLQCALETWEAVKDWRRSPWNGVQLPTATPFLLLRVSEGDRRKYQRRLKKLYERVVAQGAAQTRAGHALHVAAFGRPAVEEDQFRPWRTDRYRDPPGAEVGARLVDAMVALRPASRAMFDGRLAFLGGDAATRALAEGHARFHKTWLPSLVEQLARINHPSIEKAMTALAAKKNADAKAWLAERG